MLNSTAALQNILSSLSGLNDRQTAISTSLSTGVRIAKLSDDPAAASQAVALSDALGRDQAFLSTESSVSSRMQASDSALSAVVTQLTSAVSTAVGALSGTVNAQNQLVAAQTLSSVRDSILSLANSSLGGTYLFSGTSASQPFTSDGSGNVTYNGNTSSASVVLPSGGSLGTSLAGSDVFTSAGSSVFGALNAVIRALNAGSPSSGDSATLLGNLRSALTTVTLQRSILNDAQNRLSNEGDYVTSQKTSLAAQQSTLLSADTAGLATELSSVTTQRSALLSTLAIVQKGSLFDYL